MVSRAETRTDAANWCEKACWWKLWQIGYEPTEARNVAQVWSSLVLRLKLLEKLSRNRHTKLVWRSWLRVMKRSRSVWSQLERNVFCILCSTREMCRIEYGHPGNSCWRDAKSFQNDDHDASWYALLNEVRQRGVHVRWVQREVAFVIESTQPRLRQEREWVHDRTRECSKVRLKVNEFSEFISRYTRR